MRIFLTGAGGFLGSALAHYWVTRGHELWLLARPSSRLERLVDLSTSVQVIRSTAVEGVAEIIREVAPQAIVHTACSYGRKGETPLDVMDTNLRLGIALLQAILDISVAEDSNPITFLNAGTVLDSDVSLYALSKKQFSTWGHTLATQAPERLRFIDILIQQMYGPGDDRSKFTTHVIEACRNDESHLALTAGIQLRDFIYIDDVVQAFDCILEQRQSFASSDAIEVGSGDAVTMRSFVELTRQIAGASTRLEFGAVPYRTNEAMMCVADISRLSSLGWQPRFSLESGLKSIIKR